MSLTKACWVHKGICYMIKNSEIQNIVHKTLSRIWEYDIPRDYNNRWLLKEDTLKNALYFHLRNQLKKLFDENDVRIFTEFTDGKFKGSGYRPDIVIARIDPSKQVSYWGEAVTECLAVIEIKFKTGFLPHAEIEADYEKLRYYAEDLDVTGDLYMVTIWEYEDNSTTWIRKNAAWAKGIVTELNASYEPSSDKQMRFYVYEH